MRKYHYFWDKYSSSPDGTVFGARGNRLKPILHHTGYSVMTARKPGIQKQLRIHRFVWECHRGEIPEGLIINHINGDKRDNCIDNLEVVTHSENVLHGFRVLGRVPTRGQDRPETTLKDEDVLEIRRLSAMGYGNTEIGEIFGVSHNVVYQIKTRKRWKHL